VVAGFDDGKLIGLLLLAEDDGTLVGAGASQAEYHVWLALPGDDAAFLSRAWRELTRRIAFSTLRFKYLPSTAHGDAVRAALRSQASVVVRRYRRPLLQLDAQQIQASFATRSNKSRFKRLKRLGNLEFRRLTDLDELDLAMDDLIEYYDFRQSAANQSRTFQEDPRKRGFYRELFAASPDDLYVTVTYLEQHPIAAFWGAVSGKTVHLGMLIYSPFVAEYSPDKLHLLQLSERLLQEGKTLLDLTPGGDPWKEHFANAHDEVAEALVNRSPWTRLRSEAGRQLSQAAKRWSTRVGVTPAQLNRALMRRARLSAVRTVRNWIVEEREMRVYRGDRTLAKRYGPDERVRCNLISDLLAFEAGESWQTRDGFLSTALSRLEHGEHVYTIRLRGRLAHFGWMAMHQVESYMTEVKQPMTFPPGSVALYDFYSHPSFRGRGLYRATIGHMLHVAFSEPATQYAYISVLADNAPSRHVIETMGFEYQASFFWTRRFGSERTWSALRATSPDRPESGVEPEYPSSLSPRAGR